MTRKKSKKKIPDYSISAGQGTNSIEITRKRFRLSDYLAEKIIKSVAFLSITIIVLIFIFVFREAIPIFGTSKEVKASTTEELALLKQESYGVETVNASQEKETQETYNGSSDKQEVQELYGVQTTDSVSAADEPDNNYTVSAGSGSDSNQSALKSLVSKDWVPVSETPRYGILALIVGTFKITILSILFAAPLSILAALYTSVFANKKMKEIIKPTIELLAGFPSVVIGFFALMVLATFLQGIFHYETRLNSFVGGIAMGIAAIPIIFTITEDALTAVPKSYYEGSLAIGASKWQTAFFVILPAATPGIFAAILLGIGRVFGETMIALMATGNAAMMDLNPFTSVRTLAATIGAEMAEVVFGDTHYNVLFLIGSLLFIFTFMLNAIAEFYVKGKLMKKIQGK
jgi:phosphate transport system permease protein